MSLKMPYPSSPQRLPTHNLYISLDERILVLAYAAAYPARKIIDRLMGENGDFVWLKNDTIQLTNGIKIKSNELEELAEYKFTEEERAWELGPNDLRAIASLTYVEEPEAPPAPKVESTPKVERVKRERVAPTEPKAPRVKPEGVVTAGDLAAQLNVEPRIFRGVLRSLKLEKPEGGWAWSAADAEAIKARVAKELGK